MAETRKYQPATSAVGDAIRAALGETVRPVQPGEHAPAADLPPQGPPPAPVTTVRTFTFGTASKKPE